MLQHLAITSIYGYSHLSITVSNLDIKVYHVRTEINSIFMRQHYPQSHVQNVASMDSGETTTETYNTEKVK